jgi:NAD+ synthase (glutamine-hydrolysing)
MTSTWREQLQAYREKKAFQPTLWIENKCKAFNAYLGEHGLSGAVLSVSGGIDSAVTLALLKTTMTMPNSNLKRITVLNQPIYSSNWALDRSVELCNTFQVDLKVIDQTHIHEQLTNMFAAEGNEFSKGQLRSYLRTPANYYAAQLLSQEGFPALVVGTGNKDEDGYLAYFCKYGDGAVDIQLISDLHKSEVFVVGRELGVPNSILEASPSADLWDGHTDEEEMGVPYDFVEFLTGYYFALTKLEKLNFKFSLTPESQTEFEIFKGRCQAIHQKNAHKLKGVINL